MADRFVKIGGSNLLSGDSFGNAWETAIYGLTNVGASNTLKFSGTSGGVFDWARPDIACPVPSGSSGNPTIITDNADGVVTFHHPGTANRSGFMNFTTGAAKSYISVIATSRGNIIFDAELQNNAGSIFYFNNNTTQNSNFHIKNLDLRNCFHSSILGGQCPDVDIEDCDIHDNEPESLNNQPQNHGVYASGPRLLVHGCKIYNVSGWGIHCYSTSSPNHPGRKFFGNFIYNCGYGDTGTADDNGSGILVAEGGAEIYNNVIYKNAGHGIDVWRNTTVSIYHNTIHENGKWGIHVGLDGAAACSGTLIKNNISIGNGLGDIRLLNNSVSAVVSWNRLGSSSITDAGTGTTSNNNSFNAVAANEWTNPSHATLASRDYSLRAVALGNTSGVWSVAVASNVVTINTVSAHGLVAGMILDTNADWTTNAFMASLSGKPILSVPNSNTFTFALTQANQGFTVETDTDAGLTAFAASVGNAAANPVPGVNVVVDIAGTVRPQDVYFDQGAYESVRVAASPPDPPVLSGPASVEVSAVLTWENLQFTLSDNDSNTLSVTITNTDGNGIVKHTPTTNVAASTT